MRIGLAYNEKPDAHDASDAYAEWDDPSTIDAVDQALSRFGTVVRLEADEFFPQELSLARPDVVFNMAEGLHGPCRESHVPALCEYLNIPYTGSDPLTLALTLHKGRTKEILAYRGVPTAPFRVIDSTADVRLRSQMDLGHARASARDLPMPAGRRLRIALPGDGARRARCVSRPRVPRLVPHRRSRGSLRRAQCRRAQPTARHHPRSRDEFLPPQSRAGCCLQLRRAHPGGPADRLEAPHGTYAPGGRPGGGQRVRVVILYDPGADDWTAEDIAGVMEAVDGIARIFVSLNHQVQRVPVRHDMRWFNHCRGGRADLVFNLCEGVRGVAQWEDHVVGTLELAGIAYTGCGPWTTAVSRRKAVANTMLERAGLPVPRWTIAQGKIDDDFPLPAIVKPAAEDASAGVDRQSVVSDRKSLKARIAAMTEQFDEVLVQQYIAGREFNVGIVGTRTLPVAEIDFSTMPEGTWPILTYAAKWHVGSLEDLGSRPVCPAQIPQRLADRLCRLAEAAWRTMQGKSYGRVDLRVDDAGRPWVLEVNPTPDLTDEAGLSRMAQAAGWDYAELIRRIAELALREAQGTKAARELLAASPAPRRARAPRTP